MPLVLLVSQFSTQSRLTTAEKVDVVHGVKAVKDPETWVGFVSCSLQPNKKKWVKATSKASCPCGHQPNQTNALRGGKSRSSLSCAVCSCQTGLTPPSRLGSLHPAAQHMCCTDNHLPLQMMEPLTWGRGLNDAASLVVAATRAVIVIAPARCSIGNIISSSSSNSSCCCLVVVAAAAAWVAVVFAAVVAIVLAGVVVAVAASPQFQLQAEEVCLLQH